MKGLINIFKLLPKILLSVEALVLVLVIANPAFANKSQEYYKQQVIASRADNVYQILKKQETQGQTELDEGNILGASRTGTAQTIAYILEQLRSAANGNGMASTDEDFDDNVNDRGSFAVDDYGKSDALGTKEDGWDWYDNSQMTKDGVSVKEFRESEVTDMKQALTDGLNKAIAQGFLTVQEASAIEIEADNLIRTGTSRAIKAAEADGKGHTFIREIQDGSASALSAENSVTDGTCPSTEFLRQKYHSGCWSCLVVEKLASAFLTAAKNAYGLAQRAGITLLWIGVVMWLLMWALKNVSSLAQVEPGNILNELIKFMFKVGLAYWFIVSGLPMVKNYFIGPIMGFGASIAQQFWPERFEGYVENYVWEDEVVTEEQNKRLSEQFAKNNSAIEKPAEEEEQEKTKQEEKPVEALKIPEITKSDALYEDIVQDFQKALVQLLNQRLATLQGSCVNSTYSNGGQCKQKKPNSCRNSKCPDKGHQNAVRQIFTDAGSPGSYGAYCQITITAALEELNRQVGGNITNFQTKVGYCLTGMDVASKYKNAAITSASGGDILLREALPYANIGDTVYIRVSGESARSNVSGSGYHATTYIGNGQVISFNGDGKYNPLSAFGQNAKGRIVHINEIIRQRLLKNPAALKQIDRQKLADLAAGSGLMTLVNYTNGVMSETSGASADFSSLIIPIDDIHYSGPTDIMPKSVMNSILGATKAITDITSENMILGDAIMCYSTLERGGAWQLVDNWWVSIYMTNAFMWIEGFIIFCFGLLLTLAIVYYLMDMSFKIGFAVIALPIVVGLWPFNMTKGKFSMCVSIIAKGAATFAFLALTTTYTVALTEAVINWGDTPEAVAAGEGGIAKLYKVMDESGSISSKAVDAKDYRNDHKPDLDYAAAKLSLFSTTFVMLLFAFIYSFKLVQNTVPDLVNKFFPDKAFGETNPMHQWATAASRWVKDQAMKPVGYARDIALNQAGNALKGMPGKAVGFAKSMVGKGSGNAKTAAGSTMRGAGNVAKGTGKVAQAAGKGVQGIGKGLSAAGKGLQAIPIVGNVVGGAMMAAGKATEVAGKGVEMAGKGVEKAGDAAKKAGDATDKAYNEFGTRNKKPEGDKDK